MVKEKTSDVEDIFKYITKADVISYKEGSCKSPIVYNDTKMGYAVITNYGKTASLDLVVDNESLDLLKFADELGIKDKKKVLDEVIGQSEEIYACGELTGILNNVIKTFSIIS